VGHGILSQAVEFSHLCAIFTCPQNSVLAGDYFHLQFKSKFVMLFWQNCQST